MKVTLSVLKADIGSIGGHIKPSQTPIDEVNHFVRENGKDLVIDSYISHSGDDIAILCTHDKGEGNEKIHKLAWDAFLAETAMLPFSELEYGGIVEKLEKKFTYKD